MYPALHLVQVSDVGPQAAQPGHVIQEEAPALDHDVALHALQADVLPDGEYVPAEHFVHFPVVESKPYPAAHDEHFPVAFKQYPLQPVGHV